MASKELIEKVAWVIADTNPLYSWGELNEHGKDIYRGKAKAAISTILAALQEPTEGMIDAYFDRCRNLGIFTHINANAAWRAMIEASPLGEQSE